MRTSTPMVKLITNTPRRLTQLVSYVFITVRSLSIGSRPISSIDHRTAICCSLVYCSPHIVRGHSPQHRLNLTVPNEVVTGTREVSVCNFSVDPDSLISLGFVWKFPVIQYLTRCLTTGIRCTPGATVSAFLVLTYLTTSDVLITLRSVPSTPK